MTRRCTTPTKRKYGAESTATEHAAYHSALHEIRLEPYHCPCGWWHLRDVDKWLRNQPRREEVEALRATRRAVHEASRFTRAEKVLLWDPALGPAEVATRTGRSISSIRLARKRMRQASMPPPIPVSH